MTTRHGASPSSTPAARISATSARALLVAGLAILCAGLVVTGPHAAAVIAGLLLALVLPGVATLDALLPAGMPGIQRIVLTPALSLAVVVLGGLALDGAGVALHRAAWGVVTAGVAVAMSVVGLVRARRNPRPAPTARRSPGGTASPGQTVTRLAPLVLAVVLLAGAGWYSMRSAQDQPAPAFTALEMVPAGPVSAGAKTRSVTVGLRCQEDRVTDYEVRLTGRSRFNSTLKARLWPGGSWAQQVTVPAAGRVTAQLFRAGDKAPYRTVFLEGAG